MSVLDQTAKKNLAEECQLTRPVRSPQRVGLDGLDRLPVVSIPELFVDTAMAPLLEATTALAAEGPRGDAARRMLARDIQIARAQLRYREVVLNIETERFLYGAGDPRRLEIAERLVSGQHRRLLDAFEMFLRLEHGAPVRFRIHANAAQINLGAA
jgi:hypothetical protein